MNEQKNFFEVRNTKSLLPPVLVADLLTVAIVYILLISLHYFIPTKKAAAMEDQFSVNLSFQGKTITLSNVTTSTTGADLLSDAKLPEGLSVKMLYKGKKIEPDDIVIETVPKKTPKILIMATSTNQIAELQEKRSDPTIRGFDQERSVEKKQNDYWGPSTSQDSNYKFCRFQACTWQSFGHRPSDETPHAFRAMELLEQMATDPGVVAIMHERELVVGTLGEMDPIDDRLMQKKQQQGVCVLGYNTNGGMRIDIKLRNENLKGFRPYPELVATLIHELSHNWVGDHNLLFWTNYGQMRAEYLHTHARLRSSFVHGKTTAALAGLSQLDDNVFDFCMKELQPEMGQFGLHPNMIASAIQQRCHELDQTHGGQRLGGNDPSKTARDLALEAAERRAKESKDNGDSNY
jgi:hypothetical protein